MASEHMMKAAEGCEESKVEGGRRRGRKANAKGPKKAPQRGLGVAQLERLRMQESWKKMSEAYGASPTLHELQCHTPMFVSGNVPVMCGTAAPSSNHHVHAGLIAFQCPQQQVITGNKGWFLSNSLSSFGSGPPLLVGTPLETSKELSSMPNLHSQPQSFDLSLKKTRFNEDSPKGSNNARRERLEIGPNVNGHDFLGFKPQSAAPNLVGETGDFYNKLSRHAAADAYATPNLEECVEVVAVHRRGSSGSGRVFMEYEFFPGKDGRGTTSKEMEVATIGSAAVGGEASSITATPYGDSASNSIDLSLKLSH
ncbi:hypothetical protein VNO77_28330 [Canavalia gladiata]|uniref:Uncharacterized protein n=1 Tax=Canavalia gladiata TaxID=3824 RepID=A0AAN9QB58_CANGL